MGSIEGSNHSRVLDDPRAKCGKKPELGAHHYERCAENPDLTARPTTHNVNGLPRRTQPRNLEACAYPALAALHGSAASLNLDARIEQPSAALAVARAREAKHRQMGIAVAA